MHSIKNAHQPLKAFPRFEILTSTSGAEVYDSTVPEAVLDQVPYEQGPGDVKPYLGRIHGQYYVLGILDVCYENVQTLSQATVQSACEKVTAVLLSQAPENAMVYPSDFDSWPGRGIIMVAIPLENNSPDEIVAKLKKAFQGYEKVDNVIALAD